VSILPHNTKWLLTIEIAVEEYFARLLGITIFTLGLMIVLLTGSVPLTSSISESKQQEESLHKGSMLTSCSN